MTTRRSPFLMGVLPIVAVAAIVAGHAFAGDLASDDWYTRTAAAYELAGAGTEGVVALGEWLASESPTARIAAAHALVHVKKADGATARALIEIFEEANWELQLGVARALARIDKEAIPPLIEALDHENQKVRNWSAKVLGRIGPKTEAVVSALVASMAADQDRRNYECDTALRQIGEPAVPELVRLLEEGDRSSRCRAASNLAHMGRDVVSAVDVLVAATKDPDARVRSRAADALRGIDAQPGKTIPALTALLEDEESDVRDAAIVALGNRGPAAKPAVPVLLEILADADLETEIDVLRALAGIGLPAEDALTLFRPYIGSEDWRLADAAAEALGSLGPKASPAAEDFCRAYPKGQNDFYGYAARPLVGMGKLAVPELMKQLAAKDKKLRVRAAVVLGRIGPDAKAATSMLIRILQSETDNSIRWEVVTALVGIAPDDSQVRSALAEHGFFDLLAGLDAQGQLAVAQALLDRETRVKAVLALGRAGPLADEAFDLLVQAADDEGAQRFVAEALGQLRQQPARSVSALVRILDRDPDGAAEAAGSLAAFGAEAAPGVEVLITALRKGHSRVQIGAATALGAIGPLAAPAVPILRELMESEQGHLNITVAAAIVAIDPADEKATSMLLAGIDPNSRTAIDGLRRLGPRVKVAVPALVRAMQANSKGSLGREAAPAALAAIAPDDPVVLLALIREVGTTNSEADESAADALVALAPGAPQIVEALEMLPDKDAFGSPNLAAETLARIREASDPEPATVEVPAIIGTTAKDAKKLIEATGLKPTFDVGRVALTADQVHRVYQVEPQPGARVKNGETVVITVYGRGDN